MESYTDLEQRREDIEAQIKQHMAIPSFGAGQVARDERLAELHLKLAENFMLLQNAAIADPALHIGFIRVISYARHWASAQARYYEAAAFEAAAQLGTAS